MNNKLPHVAEKYVKTLESLILKKNIPQHSLAAANLGSGKGEDGCDRQGEKGVYDPLREKVSPY